MRGITASLPELNDLQGYGCKVLDFFGPYCDQTDLVLLTGGSVYYNSSTKRIVPFSATTLTADASVSSNSIAFVDSHEKEHSYTDLTDYKKSVRPVLNIKPEIFNRIIDNSNHVAVVNKFDIASVAIEFGCYPQVIAPFDMQVKLNKSKKRLNKTGNKYTLPSPETGFITYDEYEFEGKRYIKVKSNFRAKTKFGIKYPESNVVSFHSGDEVWVEVTPLTWLMDFEKKRLISVKNLLGGVPYHIFDGSPFISFEQACLGQFLNNHFVPEMTQSLAVTETERIKTDNLLEEINTYNEKYLCRGDIPKQVYELLKRYNESVEKTSNLNNELKVDYRDATTLNRDLNNELEAIRDYLKKEVDKIKPYYEMNELLTSEVSNGNPLGDELIQFIHDINRFICNTKLLEDSRNDLIKRLNKVINTYIKKNAQLVKNYRVTGEIPSASFEDLVRSLRYDLHDYLVYLNDTTEKINVTKDILNGTRAIIRSEYNASKSSRVSYFLDCINESAIIIKNKGNRNDMEKLRKLLSFEIDYKKTIKELVDELEDILVQVYKIELDAVNRTNENIRISKAKVNLNNVEILKSVGLNEPTGDDNGKLTLRG